MPVDFEVPISVVGTEAGPISHQVDERWLMAYAAALDDYRPEFFDTTRPEGIEAHPVFAVCPEWPVIVASRQASMAAGIPPEVVARSIHAAHDMTIHRPIRPGDELTTRLRVESLVNKSPGAVSTMTIQTVDAGGDPVVTTLQTSIYLGVFAASERPPEASSLVPLAASSFAEPEAGDSLEIIVPLRPGAAHTYTECARIWNPIHTDRAAALSAGLPDLILHGTANLAHGVSGVLRVLDRSPSQVSRVAGRFGAMTRLPIPAADLSLTVRVWPETTDTDAVRFEVLNDAGETVVSAGQIVFTA